MTTEPENHEAEVAREGIFTRKANPVPTPEATIEAAPEVASDKPSESAPAEPVAANTEEAAPSVEPEPVKPTKAAPSKKSPVDKEALAELTKARDEAQAKLEEEQRKARKPVIDQIAAVVKAYNIPILELVEALGGVPNPRKGEKVPPLYTDGKNTWSGRGCVPKWLRGKNLEDYKIK